MGVLPRETTFSVTHCHLQLQLLLLTGLREASLPDVVSVLPHFVQVNLPILLFLTGLQHLYLRLDLIVIDCIHVVALGAFTVWLVICWFLVPFRKFRPQLFVKLIDPALVLLLQRLFLPLLFFLPGLLLPHEFVLQSMLLELRRIKRFLEFFLQSLHFLQLLSLLSVDPLLILLFLLLVKWFCLLNLLNFRFLLLLKFQSLLLSIIKSLLQGLLPLLSFLSELLLLPFFLLNLLEQFLLSQIIQFLLLLLFVPLSGEPLLFHFSDKFLGVLLFDLVVLLSLLLDHFMQSLYFYFVID